MVRTDVTHLDDNAASEFVSGSLPPSAVTRIERHLAGCRDCRALVAALAADAADDSHAATVPAAREPTLAAPAAPARTPPARRLAIGDRVGRYLVLSTLGAGGMGVVFAAYDPHLDRKVALKLLRAGLPHDTQDARARLRREAQAIAQLSHPNVVAVYDVGTLGDGDLYIAMEFVEGDTLTTWLRNYPRTWREIVDVFLQAARGLYAAHSVGLLHRDFKPDNVLVGGDGRVRVTDFGLARSVITPEVGANDGPDAARRGGAPDHAALSVELTATGTVLGTPRYMAPEQLTGPDIDARADQFSFCVALYEALYGAHPLPGATSVGMLERAEKALPPPETSKVPAPIARAVLTGLERERARRFPTMGALIAALGAAPKRSPWRYAMLAAAALAAGGAVAAVGRPEGPAAAVPVDERGRPIDQIGPLVEKINELQDQLHKREAENRALLAELAERRPDALKIEQLRAEIATRDAAIDRLLQEAIELKRTRGRAPAPAVPAARGEAAPIATRQGELVRAAFDGAHGSLESCFSEWSLRQPGDADLSFTMTVSADGVAHDTEPGRDTRDDDRLGPSLRHCVGAALERLAFPRGPDNLDLDVSVQWSPESRLVAVSARVAARRPGTRTVLD